jgi:hypothetical protein
MQWIENLLKTYGKIILAEQAKDLQDNQQVLANDRAAVQAHHRRTFGESYQAPQGDDVIHIGDQHQHLHQAARGLGLLGKLAMGFAFGGPIGLGIAALPFVADWLRPDPPASAAPQAPSADRDSISGIELLDPRFPE